MGRRLHAALLVVALASSTQAERWWVRLPRAESYEELTGFPVAPAPSPRALARRSARGDAEQIARLSRGPSRSELQRLRREVVSIHRVSRWLASASCELTPEQLTRLRARYGEASLLPVRSLRVEIPSLGPPRAAHPGPYKTAGVLDYGPAADQIAMIEVDRLHARGFSGRGVRILVLDTGFLLDLPALRHIAPVATWDFVQDDATVSNESTDLPTQHDHGSGVLSQLAGYDPGFLIGPAFAAEFVLAKTEDLAGETRREEDNFVAALEWGEALGVDLCTASLAYWNFDDGSSYAPEDLDGDTAVTTRAMDAAVAMGVVALSAAGNAGAQGPGSLWTPADADSVLAIGSVRADSLRSNFSSQGPTYDGRIKPDLMARGTDTVWALSDGSYSTTADGTSTATPQAAGAAALLLEVHPEWNAMQFVEALRTTATRAAFPDDEYGYGIVRAHAAAFDVEVPAYPFPFDLLEPADAAILDADRAATFRWRRARDLQSPGGIDYELQLAADPDFTQILQRAEAGADSALTLALLATGATRWRVVARDNEGHARASAPRGVGISTASATPPADAWAWFRSARPNPFRTKLLLPIELQRAARIDVTLVDVRGRMMRSWPGEARNAGLFLLDWDGRDEDGDDVAAGVYWLRIRAKSGSQTLEHRQRVLRLP